MTQLERDLPPEEERKKKKEEEEGTPSQTMKEGGSKQTVV
jgi:hypothetical protein